MNRKDINDKYKWNLKDLIASKKDYETILSQIKQHSNLIVNMSNDIISTSSNLFKYLEINRLLSEKLDLVYVFSYLKYYEDMSNEEGLFYKNTIDKFASEIKVELSEINTILMSVDYKKIEKFIEENKDLKKYDFYLKKLYSYQCHTLDDKEERILALCKKTLGGAKDIFLSLNNIDISLGYIKDDKNKKILLNNSNYSKFITSRNTNIRRNAFNKMTNYYKNHINTFYNCFYSMIKESSFLSNVRKFDSSLKQCLFSDNIEEDFYYFFINEVNEYLPLLHRYMNIRKNYFGYKNHMYDLYLDFTSKEYEEITYKDAQKYIIEALSILGNDYTKILKDAFKNRWIDVYYNDFKRSGAFSWGCFLSHPYILINYENNYNSLSTLAHELGHCVHTFYSNKNNISVYANYSIFLAEIASLVNEILLCEHFIKTAKNKNDKIYYINKIVESIRTTIYRQTLFADFEVSIHNKFSSDDVITKDIINNEYFNINKKYYGKNVVVDKNIMYEWARIPHFYTPFYVYKYATGFIMALTIVNKIINEKGYVDKYINLLKSGFTDYPLEILKKCDIDITKKDTIAYAFKYFEDKLDLLEELLK